MTCPFYDDKIIKGDRMTYEKLMIAVDGGGTKTEAVLFTEKGKILKRLVTAGSNPNTVGTENAIKTITELIEEISASYTAPRGIFIGCAGCATGDNAEIISNALLKRFPDSRIECVSDILTAAKSITDVDCICCISGTGSTVAVIEGSSIRLFSGTGPLLGDKGSGFSIGRDALNYAIEARDFCLAPDSLTKAVEDKLSGTVRDSIPYLYKSGAPAIAAFAKTVFDQYETSEKAREIICDNARYISSLIKRIFVLYPHINTAVFTGSLFGNTLYISAVSKSLDKNLIFSTVPQLTGAAVLCLKMCGENTDNIRDTFIKSYYEFTAGDNNA